MVSRWSYRVFAAAVPVIAALALIVIAVFQAVQTETPPEEIKAGYVDMTRGQDGQPLFSEFRVQGQTEFLPYPDEETGTQALLASDIRQLFIIPQDYLSTGLVREVRLETSGIPSASAGSPSTTPLGRFLLANLFADVASDRAERALLPYQLQTLEIDQTGAPVTDEVNFGQLGFFIVIGALLITSIFMTSGYLLQGLSDEKENRVMEVLLSSVKPEQLLLGKLFGLGAAGLFQMFIWAVTGVVFVIVLGTMVDIPADVTLLPSVDALVIALIYFLLGYFFFGTLMAALGAITTTQREANQVTFLIVMPGVAPLWFLQALLENPDGTLATVLSFIPFTAPVVSLIRLGLGSMGWLHLVLSIAILAASVALAMFITARLFRAYLLMYGQRPGLRQVLLTIRGA